MTTVLRMSRLFVLLSVFIALAVPAMARADDPGDPRHPHPALIGGTVVDSNGDAVAGAEVVLARRDHVLQRTRTDDQGHYRFEAVRPGVYGVRAAKEGVGRGGRRVFAHPGRNLVRIRLR